jgi:DNA-binding transcriptional MerR regulator
MSQPAVAIPEKLFFKIGEVCDIVEVQAHVLRYWESEFPSLAPQKNRAGQRTYRKRDVEMALRIKELLYEEKYTIAGAKKRLQNESRGATKLMVVPDPVPNSPSDPMQPSLLGPEGGLHSELRSSFVEFSAPSSESATAVNHVGALRKVAGELHNLLRMIETNDTFLNTPKQ